MRSARHNSSRQHPSGGDRHRSRVRAVQAWAMAGGQPVGHGALLIICEVKASRDCHPGAFDRWESVDVEEMVWVDVVEWCTRQGIDVPEQLAEALWLYLDYLDATSSFASGSDDIVDLREPLLLYSGLGSNGRRKTLRLRRRRQSARSHAPQPVTAAAPGGLAPIIPLRGRDGRSLLGA